MEALLQAGQHTHAQVYPHQAKLLAAHAAASACRKTLRSSAQALRLVADSRDAFAYYRVGEELGLLWDFSDPEVTRRLINSTAPQPSTLARSSAAWHAQAKAWQNYGQARCWRRRRYV